MFDSHPRLHHRYKRPATYEVWSDGVRLKVRECMLERVGVGLAEVIGARKSMDKAACAREGRHTSDGFSAESQSTKPHAPVLTLLS